MINCLIFQGNYTDKANVYNDAQMLNLQITQQKMSKFGSIPRYYRNYSLEAVKYFPDQSLDFVFLDARYCTALFIDMELLIMCAIFEST